MKIVRRACIVLCLSVLAACAQEDVLKTPVPAAPTPPEDISVLDGSLVADDVNPTVNALNFGNICQNTTATRTLRVYAEALGRGGKAPYSGQSIWKNSASLSASVSGSNAEFSATLASNTLGLPDDWQNYSNNTRSPKRVNASVAFAAGQTLGAVNRSLTFTLSGQGSNTATVTKDGTVNISATVVSCNQAPVINLQPVREEGDTLGGWRFANFSDIGTASDNEDGTPTVTCTPAIGSVLPIGANTVSCTARDSAGLTASATTTITVGDTAPPIITNPNDPVDVTLEATEAKGANVTWTPLTATDVVDGTVPVACDHESGSNFAVGSTTVTCTAKDKAGNSDTESFTVTVQDKTPPEISNMPEDIVQEATGPNGAIATWTAPTATDAVAGEVTTTCLTTGGLKSGDTFPVSPDNTTSTAVTCTATDTAGNQASKTFAVTVKDTKAPIISGVPDQPIVLEATGPGGAESDFPQILANDIVDGDIELVCTGPKGKTTYPIGTTTVTCTATDTHGNHDSAQITVTVQDTTPPEIKLLSRTEANAAGWNNSDVAMVWACTDLVGVKAAELSQTLSSEGAGQSATGTCEDTYGHKASDTQTDINIDKTAPSAEKLESGELIGGWYKDSVTVSFSGQDELSGIASVTAPQTFNTTATFTYSGTATDKAGNISQAATGTVKVDATAPTVAYTTCPTEVKQGTVSVSWSASDVGAGVSGSSSGSSTLDTNGVGTKSVSVSVKDNVGHSTTATCTYNVVYNFTGFFQPVDMNGVYNVAKAGSAIPVKFSLRGNQGLGVFAAGYPRVGAVSCSSSASQDAIEEAATATTSGLKYDATADQYNYTWKTTSSYANTCQQLSVKLADGKVYTALFRFNK